MTRLDRYDTGTNPSVVRRLFSSGSGNPTLQTVLDVLDVLGLQIELKQLRAEEMSPEVRAPRKRPRAEKGAAA